MIRRGVCDVDDLRSGARDFAGRGKFVAISLYDEIASGSAPDKEPLLEEVLARFPTGAGVFKRTQSARFDRFQEAIASLVAERKDLGRPFRVHDLGVSDGRTSVDLFRRLRDFEDPAVDFLASDAAPDVVVVRAPGERLQLAIDGNSGEPVQIIFPPFVFNVTRKERAIIYPANRVIHAALERTLVPRLLARYRRNDPRLDVRRIRLLHPECLALTDDDSVSFRFERRDMLEPSDDRFDMVRAMNVLNPSYFPPDPMHRAVANIHASLATGGIFATGSNQDRGSPVLGGIYRRTERGFDLIEQADQPSPIAELIGSFSALARDQRSAG